MLSSVTRAGLSVTKAGLHPHISPNVTKRDGTNQSISCAKTHKTGHLSTIYRTFEIRHEKGQKPLVLSHNPEVAGSSPASATKKKDICFQQMSFFCAQTPGAGRAALLTRPAGIARFQRVFRFSSPFRGGRSPVSARIVPAQKAQ